MTRANVRYCPLMVRLSPWWTLVAFAMAAALPDCFFDSASVLAAQQRSQAAKTSRPRLGAEATSSPNAAAHTYTLRVYATPAHAAEVPAWKQRFTQTVDDANGVLEPAVGVRLAIERATTWSAPNEDALAGVLDALARHDDGAGVDFVVALVGSVPRLEISFRELGVARPLGKHIVLRSVNDAAEWDAVEQIYADVAESDRRAQHEARRRHKAATSLLHELGHALGAPHVRENRRIMSRVYDVKTTDFAPSTLAVLRVGVRHGSMPEAQRDREAHRRDLLGVLNDPTRASWVEEERAELVEALQGATTPASPSAAPSTGAAPEAVAAPRGLDAADAAAFARAEAALSAGDVAQARAVATPLFERHPNVLEVQDLRCRIAMRAGGSFDAVQRECARLKALSTGAPR